MYGCARRTTRESTTIYPFHPTAPPQNQDEADAAAFVDNDPYAKAGLFASTFVTQLAELDVTGQHLDRQWEKFQLEGT